MESLSLFAILAGIVTLGFIAQWLAWRLGIPSIVFLFAAGLIAGPGTGLLSPDALFGDLMFPVVSALVGIVLFEGGLTLNVEELGDLKTTVFKVIILGGFITFILTSLAAYCLFDFSVSLTLLLGGILVVTGPTVVIPLLHQIRPQGDVGSVARWEGIIIDPLGAILAVILYEIVLSGVNGTTSGYGLGVLIFGESILVGGSIGVIAGYGLIICFDRYWIPDYLHNFAILATVLTAQALSNQILHESGLLAVTIMGMYMAYQNKVTIRHILSFKEDLRVLFISALFIILVARLDRSFVLDIQPNQLIFLGVLILLVRPIAIGLSTLGSRLSWAERGFLAWIAPRGIVAAAVASLFSYKLEQLGIPGASQLTDVTFLVIAGTVVVYGLTLGPLSRLLDLSELNPQGILIVGAHRWARAIAQVLRREGILVRMVDKRDNNILRAKQADIPVRQVDVTAESELHSTNIQGIGYFLALTSNDEVNTLACLHATDMGFDRSEIFQLAPHTDFETNDEPDPLKGRTLFGGAVNFEDINRRFNSGWNVEVVTLETLDDVKTVHSHIPDGLLPLVRLYGEGRIDILPIDDEFEFYEGDRIVVLRDTDLELNLSKDE